MIGDPIVNDRIIDLSSKAADILDLKKKGYRAC